MQKKYKYLLIHFFLFFLLLLPSSFCFSAPLEVNYPTLASGASVTASTSAPAYLKYVFDFGLFIGFLAVFLSLTYAGILYFLSPAIPSALSRAKDRISGAISGLLILVLLYLIITTINPTLSIFDITPLEPLPPPAAPRPIPGVLLYRMSNCTPEGSGTSCGPFGDCGGSLGSATPCPSGQLCNIYLNKCQGVCPNEEECDIADTWKCVKNRPFILSASVPDLSKNRLNKEVKSVKIVNIPSENIYFFANLYENPKFRGKCLIVDYNDVCKNTDPWASSVDIFKQSLSASGDITIYRNDFFNDDGGYFTIKSSDVQTAIGKGSAYFLDLNKTYFRPAKASTGCTVPLDQQNCVKYDTKGTCTQRECPTLAEKNIGSIKIQGSYFVLLFYFDPKKDTATGPWNNCQSFATIDDINKDGPRQIKWEEITNKNSITLPNWIMVMPIEKP